MIHGPYAEPVPGVPCYSIRMKGFQTRQAFRPFLPVRNVQSTDVSVKHLFVFHQSVRLSRLLSGKHIHRHIPGLCLKSQRLPKHVPCQGEFRVFPDGRSRRLLRSRRQQYLYIPIRPAESASTGDYCHSMALLQSDCRHTLLL